MRRMTNGSYAAKGIAQSYLRPTVEAEDPKAACGSACGTTDLKPEGILHIL